MADRLCRACGRPLEPDAGPRRQVCRRKDCERQRTREKVRRHRGGASRRRAATVVEFPAPAGRVSLTEAVRDALDEVDQTESWQGRAALILAQRIDETGNESGSAFAALVAKLETTMAQALRPRPGASFVDELRRRRQERVRGGRR
jgi:hypothetical protein